MYIQNIFISTLTSNKNLKLLLFLIISPLLTIGQSFPDKCIGIWEGKMDIYKQNIIVYQVDVICTIAKIDSTSWTWKTEYLSENKPITKDYILRIDNIENQSYIIDEGNGILLNEQVFGNKMISTFETSGILITSSYELRDDVLIFEVNSGSITNLESDEVHPIKISNSQRVIMKKTDNKH